MGDSEIAVAQASAAEDHNPTRYSATDYGDAVANAAHGYEASVAGADGNLGAPTVGATSGDLASTAEAMDADSSTPPVTDQSSGNAEDIDLNVLKQDDPSTIMHVSHENITSVVNTSMDSSHASANGNNDSEANIAEVAALGENGISSDVHGYTSQQAVDESVLSPEEEKLWSIVRANSLDFNAWTALIEETEKIASDNILKIRKVYDTFLAEFPLCYGYWKKYADHEARLGSMDKVVEVYERAVQGVTYSVDMWLHYCVFAIATYGDPETIRRLFERGLAYVGTDYLSFQLWDKYIEYEYQQQQWSNLASIYTRILENPNQQLDRYFTSFRELVASRPLTELRTAEEVAALASAKLEAGGQDNEGEVHPNTVEQSLKPVSAGLTEAEELENYMAIREELYKKAKEFDSKIIDFETAIRRPYFHVRPLNIAELENWHNYLDFIEAGDDFNKLSNICLVI